MRKPPEERNLWVALVLVRRMPGTNALMDRNEAYVNVAAYEASLEAFKQAVASAAKDFGFEVLEMEDAEPLAQRREAFQIPPEMEAIAEKAERTKEVVFGTFFTWVSESDEES